MMNKIDSGIHLVLTYEEAIAVLRAMAEGRFAMESEHKDDLPHEEAKVAKLWENVRLKIKMSLTTVRSMRHE